MKFLKESILILLSTVLAITLGICQEINYATNVKTEIAENQMLITYDAIAVGGIPFFEVNVNITYNGEKVQTNSIYGDYGSKISPGIEKTIVWYYKDDFKFDIQNVIVNIFAYKPIETPVFQKPEISKTVNPLIGSIVIRGGVNLSDLLVKHDDATLSEDLKLNPSFHFGVTAELPVNRTLSFEPGLLFSTKGAKKQKEDAGVEFEEQRILNYLEVPLNAKIYLYQESLKVFSLFGPYIGYGLTGRFNYEIIRGGVTQTKTIEVKWGSDPVAHDFKTLDFGLSAGVGIDYHPYLIGLSFSYGLANISSGSGSGEKFHNRVFGFFAGVKFGGKLE